MPVPYFQPDKKFVGFSIWEMSMLDTEVTTLPPRLPQWNPGTSIAVQRRVNLDLDAIREQSLLPERAKLRLVVTWYSAASKTTGLVVRRDIDESGDWSWLLKSELPGDRIGGSMTIRTSLILAFNPAPVVGSPRYPGSILVADEFKFTLGQESGFAVCLDDFNRTAYDHDSSWFLDVRFDDLSVPFTTAVLLRINSNDKTLVQATTALRPSSAQKALVEDLAASVERLLMLMALKVGHVGELGGEWPNESAGDVLQVKLQDSGLQSSDMDTDVAGLSRIRSSLEGAARRQGLGRKL